MRTPTLITTIAFMSLTLAAQSGLAGTPYVNVHCQDKTGVTVEAGLEVGCANELKMFKSGASRTVELVNLKQTCDAGSAAIVGVQSFKNNTLVVATDSFSKPEGSDQVTIASTPEKFKLISNKDDIERFAFKAQVTHVFYKNGEKQVKVYPSDCDAEVFLNY